MEGLSSSSFSSSSSSSSSLLYRPVVTSNFSQCEGKPVHLGIDEAGRGCVLGPMVYACFYSPIDEEKKLTSQLRVDDSKKLKKSQREEIYEDLITKHRNSFGWSIHAIRPEEISAKMLRKKKYSLNEISHDTAISLIYETIKHGVNVQQVFVDTVGPASVYQKMLSKRFPSIQITVAEKADSLFPVVSAASILAKVTRDTMLTQWRPLWSLSSETPTPTISTTSPPPSLSSSSGRGDERKDLSGAGEEEKKQNEEKEKEGENKRKREKSDDGSRREESKRFKEENGSKQIKREEEEGEKWKEEKEEEDHEEKKIHLGDIKSSSSPSWNFGSGYPGDALTLKFLNENFDEVFGFDSSLVRFSWSTAKLIFEKRGVPVDWYDEVDDGDDEEKDEASGGENKDGNLSKAKKGRQSRITSFFQMRPQGFKSSSSSPSPNISRPAFFVRNHLQLLSDLPLS